MRAGLAFGDLESARRTVAETAEEALAACGLARPPRLRVRVRAEPAWRAPVPPEADVPPTAAGATPGSTPRVSRSVTATNRAALLGVGAVLLVSGAALASTTRLVRDRLPAHWPRLPAGRTWLDGEALGR